MRLNDSLVVASCVPIAIESELHAVAVAKLKTSLPPSSFFNNQIKSVLTTLWYLHSSLEECVMRSADDEGTRQNVST